MEPDIAGLRARIFALAEEAARLDRGWGQLVRQLEDAEDVLAAGRHEEAEELCSLSEREVARARAMIESTSRSAAR